MVDFLKLKNILKQMKFEFYRQNYGEYINEGVITMNNALKIENRIKILKENGKENGNIIRKLTRKLRKLKGDD